MTLFFPLDTFLASFSCSKMRLSFIYCLSCISGSGSYGKQSRGAQPLLGIMSPPSMFYRFPDLTSRCMKGHDPIISIKNPSKICKWKTEQITGRMEEKNVLGVIVLLLWVALKDRPAWMRWAGICSTDFTEIPQLNFDIQLKKKPW